MLYATLIKAARELNAAASDPEYLRGIVELISLVSGAATDDEFIDFEKVKNRVQGHVAGREAAV